MYLDIFVDSRIRSTRCIDARLSIRRRRGCTTYAHRAFGSLTHDLPSPSYLLTLAIFLCLCRFSVSLLLSSPLSTMIHTSHGIRIGMGFTGAEGTSEVNSRIHVKREMTRTKCQTVAGMDMACRVLARAQLARVRDRTNHARTRNLDDKEHSASHTASRFPPRKPGETIKNLAEYSPTYELP